MFPSMLLLAEVIILAATFLIYLRARSSLRSFHTQETTSVDDAKIARELATLLSELQKETNAAREDWKNQCTQIDRTLKRAEATATELRALVNMADNKPTTKCEVSAPGLSLADSISRFENYLSSIGRNKANIARALGHVREFVHWQGGQRYAELPLKSIEPDELETYVAFLQSQNYQPTTLQRKLNALDTYIDWTNENASKPSTPTPTSKKNELGIDRSQMVQSLAAQGMDRKTIAARTGLEQEAVRLMLMMRAPSCN